LWQEEKKGQNKEIEKSEKENLQKQETVIFLLKKDFLLNWTSAKKGSERLSSVHQVVCFTFSYRDIIDINDNNNKNKYKLL